MIKLIVSPTPYHPRGNFLLSSLLLLSFVAAVRPPPAPPLATWNPPATLPEGRLFSSTVTGCPRIDALHSSLLYLGSNTRPDAPSPTTAHFLLRSTNARFTLQRGQHLHFRAQGEQLIRCPQQEADLHLCLATYAAQDALFLLRPSNQLCMLEQPPTPLLRLPTMQALPPDPLFSLYGDPGDLQQSCYRLFFPATGAVISALPAALLSYNHHRWQAVSAAELAATAPCARIERATRQGIDITFWDVPGWQQQSVDLPIITAPASPPLPPLPRRCRQQAQPGEWWVYTSQQWQTIDALQEMEDLLAYRCNGPLLIVETVHQQEWVEGNLFDRLRIGAKKMRLPIEAAPQ